MEKFEKYADDTNLISSGKTLDEAKSNMLLCLQAALSWFHENRLVVNTNKSTLKCIPRVLGYYC